MTNLFSYIPSDIDCAVVVQGRSIEFGTNWTFEYIDITAKFQFLIIKLLKHENIANTNLISNIFGLPKQIVENLMEYMKKLGLIEISQGDNYQLTDYGQTVDQSKKITEKEVVFMVSEICSRSQTFLGQGYFFIDKTIENIQDITPKIDFENLNNKPENSIELDNTGYIVNKYNTHIILSKNKPVRIISESGKEIKLNGSKLNINVSKLKKFLETIISDNIENQPYHLNYENIKFHPINNKKFAIEIINYDALSNYLKILPNNLMMIALTDSKDDTITYIRKISIISYDYNSAILLFLKLLDSKPRSFWNELLVKNNLMSELWKICTGNTDSKIPDTKQLVNIALENKLFKIVKNLKEKEDIYAKTY